MSHCALLPGSENMRAPVHGNQLLKHKKRVKTFDEKKTDPSTIDTQIWNANVMELMGNKKQVQLINDNSSSKLMDEKGPTLGCSSLRNHFA